METLYRQLEDKIKKYNPNADFDILRKAFDFCCEAHKNQKRISGEPYAVHPLNVAIILADLELDTETIVAGLLHDVIEDTDANYHLISENFGEDVAKLVEGVTKLEKIKYTSNEEQQVDNLRKMFFAMANDVRVVLIKLADRLHNVRTLQYMSLEKQREKARETLEVYAPLAHRLGISKIKGELEDLSLRYLDSIAYFDIEEGVKKKLSERDEYVSSIKEILAKKLKEMGINGRIDGRAKHYYSIFRKMYMQNKTLDEIYDLIAVRIIVDSVEECYAILGMVHELYTPLPGRIKDYIAMPKPNLYRSLHTTVMGPEGHPVEIQIRTWEMHKVAEEGVAAHWKYKEGVNGKTDMDEALSWIRQMLETQNEVTDSEEFMQTLKIDLFADEVFVFTPKGDVISLPAGATPIDFAFYIHSAVGYRMTGAKVNSRIVTLDTKLQNGDIVEILTTSAVHGPSRDWLKVVKTSQARNKINAWFKKENREQNKERGKDAVEKEIKRTGHSQSELLKQNYIDKIIHRYGFNSLDDMYAAVGYGGITANKIALRLVDCYLEEHKQENTDVKTTTLTNKKSYNSAIEVEGVDNCLVHLSRCCAPVHGDEIVGFITRGRGVTVHRSDCINILDENLSEEMISRKVHCTWNDVDSNKYKCDLELKGTDRMGLLADVAGVISEGKILLLSLNAKQNKDKTATISLSLEIDNVEKLDQIIKKLKQIVGMINVRRVAK